LLVVQQAAAIGPPLGLIGDHRHRGHEGDRQHQVIKMDKAGWHTAGDLVVPDNLSLVFLPPYSPELNPIERLRLHLRDNRLSQCVFHWRDRRHLL
jgi:transposase